MNAKMQAEMQAERRGTANATAKVTREVPLIQEMLHECCITHGGHSGFSVKPLTGTNYLGYGESSVTVSDIWVNCPYLNECNKNQYEITLHNTDGGRIQLDIDGSSRTLGVDPQFVIDTIKHLITTGYLNSEDIPDDVQGGAP